MTPSQFFSQSWVISLKELPEDLKRLVTLLLLDTISTFLLEQGDSDCPGGYRQLRHLLVVDEARKILREKKSESLVDLIRKGRSKGSVVMLLSQDPSDFEGQADDFLSQLGTVIAFACNQTKSGLGALAGVFGRKLQAAEFSDTQLEAGVAFVKLPNRAPERIRCWKQ
jgi:DNA helicase HerA-like ATPase